MNVRVSVLCAHLMVAGAPLCAQSVFNSAGIGLPIEALDGRARALGSFGIGLQGVGLLPSDPAAAAGVLLPTGMLVAQHSWVDLAQDGVGEHESFGGTRFPLVGLAYPAFDGTLTLHLSSVFDQRFRGERQVAVVLGGETLPARDFYAQEGSVSTLSAGYARMIDERIAVGISLSRYTGAVARSLGRDYGETGIVQVESYESTGSWDYSGEALTGGASAEFLGAVRVAASVTWSTSLSADATGETAGGDRAFDVPLQFRLGASTVLTPGMSLSASAFRADWSGTSDQIGGSARASAVTGFGVGMELSQARFLGRRAPLRVGFRRAGLPFGAGGGSATERVFSGGLALVLNESSGVVLATADFGVEKGRRAGGGFTEDYWRGTASIRLSGF